MANRMFQKVMHGHGRSEPGDATHTSFRYATKEDTHTLPFNNIAQDGPGTTVRVDENELLFIVGNGEGLFDNQKCRVAVDSH